MKRIGIIGGGFSGTMTAVHLLKNSPEALDITIIDKLEFLNKGVAYNPYSLNHLLNVPAGRMSAFTEFPNHFVDWVMERKKYKNTQRNIIANSFLPRYLYGEYLTDIWNKVKVNLFNGSRIHTTNEFAIDLSIDSGMCITLESALKLNFDSVVIATGNYLPRNPEIKNIGFFESNNYHRNPWSYQSVNNVDEGLPVLIIGNGLTMVDTVMALLENGFKNTIYSISPSGFNILPHRHHNITYKKLAEELPENPSLREIVHLFNKHIKEVRKYGVSAEPIIDSIRSITQSLWQKFSDREKKIFMNRLRHMWGVARHRIPLHIHDKIQQLRIENKLLVYAGRISDITQNENHISVNFYHKKKRADESIRVSRVINCTGPETDFSRVDDPLMQNCLNKGIIAQDPLRLGINADLETFQLINRNGEKIPNLFTLGSNLKGLLWESTAVNELRNQSEKLAKSILNNFTSVFS